MLKERVKVNEVFIRSNSERLVGVIMYKNTYGRCRCRCFCCWCGKNTMKTFSKIYINFGGKREREIATGHIAKLYAHHRPTTSRAIHTFAQQNKQRTLWLIVFTVPSISKHNAKRVFHCLYWVDAMFSGST